MAATHGISDEAWARALEVHDSAMAKGTLANYDGGMDHFRQWARAERIVWDGQSAVPEPVLCAYAGALAGIYSGGAARSKVGGVRYWHERKALQWAGSERLKRILKGVDRCAPPDSHRAPRPPVTEAMLDEALDALHPTRPFDVCCAAAMLVLFWGQLRIGEALSATRAYDYDALPTVQCAKLRADAGGEDAQVTTAVWLPRTKVDRDGAWVWLARHHNDPSFALQEHIRVNRLGQDDPLFAYRHDRTDAIVPLTRGAFLSRLNEIWSSAGMQRVTGHCFRIGGTTALLRAGVDPQVVKVAGRWRSDSFMRYWRAVDEIIAAHVDLCDVYWSPHVHKHTPQF